MDKTRQEQEPLFQAVHQLSEEYKVAAQLSVTDHFERIETEIERMKSQLDVTQKGYLRIQRELRQLDSSQQIQTKYLDEHLQQRISNIQQLLKRISKEYQSHQDNLNQQRILLEQNTLLLANRTEALDQKVTQVEQQMGYRHVYDQVQHNTQQIHNY